MPGPGGHAVFRGRTHPWLPRPEPTSGLAVHVLDFSPIRGADACPEWTTCSGNALGQSYVTGYGVDHTRHLRTRQFGHDLGPHQPVR